MLTSSQVLVIGASLSAVAAAVHVACIFIGPSAYRLLGAGERMARSVEAGMLRPTLITLAIAGVLLLWSAYALSGAGVIAAFPFTKPALVLISTIYISRGVCFPLLKSSFPENSNIFWWVSSGICILAGLIHAYGTLAL